MWTEEALHLYKNVYQILKIYYFGRSIFALIYFLPGYGVSYPTHFVLLYIPNTILHTLGQYISG